MASAAIPLADRMQIDGEEEEEKETSASSSCVLDRSADQEEEEEEEDVDDLTDAVSIIKQHQTVTPLYRQLWQHPGNKELEQQVLKHWFRYFQALDLVEAKHPWSHTDVGWLALCRSRTGPHSSCVVQSIAESWVKMAVIACQHTPASRRYWPSAKEWSDFTQEAASVCATWFCNPNPVALVRKLQAVDFTRIADEELESRYHERRQPRSMRLAMELAEKKKQSAKKNRPGAAKRRKLLGLSAEQEEIEQAEQVSEEAVGCLWRNTAEELAIGYVPLVKRLYYRVELEEALAKEWPEVKPLGFTRACFTRITQWVNKTCETEPTEELTEMYRNLANEWWTPLGAETKRYRSRDTRTDVMPPLLRLQDELGVDLSQHLHDRSLIRPHEIAATQPDNDLHQYWEPLFLALFHALCMQKYSLDWLKEYWLPHPIEHVRSLRQEYHRTGRDKLPQLFWLKRKCNVFYKRKRMVCQGVVHAVLCWLYIVATDFDGFHEGGECIQEGVIDLLLDVPNAIQS
jgi:hypothetical protein